MASAFNCSCCQVRRDATKGTRVVRSVLTPSIRNRQRWVHLGSQMRSCAAKKASVPTSGTVTWSATVGASGRNSLTGDTVPPLWLVQLAAIAEDVPRVPRGRRASCTSASRGLRSCSGRAQPNYVRIMCDTEASGIGCRAWGTVRWPSLQNNRECEVREAGRWCATPRVTIANPTCRSGAKARRTR